jgi:hypothetical protein
VVYFSPNFVNISVDLFHLICVIVTNASFHVLIEKLGVENGSFKVLYSVLVDEIGRL